MLYSLNDAKAAERHETQYFEMSGNRGIYHKGWTAVTKYRTPRDPGAAKQILPSTTMFGSCTTRLRTGASPRNLARENPQKLLDSGGCG